MQGKLEILCDGCGKKQQPGEAWWVVVERPWQIMLRPFTPQTEFSLSALFFCCPSHAADALVELMAARENKGAR